MMAAHEKAKDERITDSNLSMSGGADEQDPNNYFRSYNDVSVHELMLKDRPRTLAYRRFFETYREVIKDKVVMDVGAGTGILSLFAASAGARKVYAIEASDIVHLCREVVEENGLHDTIEVIHGTVESITLDVKVDVIVSEWMGFYLLHESMLDSVISARDTFLAKDGIMAPSHADIQFAPVDLTEHFQDRADEWSNIYGYDFSPVASAMNVHEVSQPLVKCLSPLVLRAEPQELLKIDLKTVTHTDVRRFVTQCHFTVSEDTRVHGFACWFNVYFSIDVGDNRSLSKCDLPKSSMMDEKGDCRTERIISGTDSSCTVRAGSGDGIMNSGNGSSVQMSGSSPNTVTEDKDTHSASKIKPSSPSTSTLVDVHTTAVMNPSSPQVSLKTGPHDPPTHWKQTTIFLPQTIFVGAGTDLCCRVTMAQDVTSNKRHYNITVALTDDINDDEDGDDDDNIANYLRGAGDGCETDDDDDNDNCDDEEEDHAVPCGCGSDRCKLLAALVEKYGEEHDQLGDEAEQVEINAEVEAARQLDADIEKGGWPMDTSGATD